MTAPGNDVSNFFTTAAANDEFYLQDKDDATKWQSYRITGSIAASLPSYFEYPIVWIAGGSPLVAQRIMVALTKK